MDDLNGLTLAYIGDAIYEVMVRDYLILSGMKKVDNLHKEAIKFTSAEGQEKAFHLIETMLTEQELGIFKRGRNSKTDRKARNASLSSYRKSTGFEALVGYLHINKKSARLYELFQVIVEGLKDA